jgi:hypothetical protein
LLPLERRSQFIGRKIGVGHARTEHHTAGLADQMRSAPRRCGGRIGIGGRGRRLHHGEPFGKPLCFQFRDGDFILLRRVLLVFCHRSIPPANAALSEKVTPVLMAVSIILPTA